MLDISCSIVLYHNPTNDVRNAIESFLSCRNQKIKLYLIDNSADDNFRFEFISPQIEYIFTGQNIGFGAAHNLAIRKCIGHSRFHLILNPDIEFEPHIIEKLLHFAEQRPEVGLIMPKVLYRSGDIQFLARTLPSPADLFLRRFIPGPLKFMFRKFLDNYELKQLDYNGIMEIPNLCGCFMFIPTDVFKVVGYFDEQYFLYCEDLDLSRRINEYYQTIYYPLVSVVHGYARGSTKNIKLFLHHLQSAYKYFNKWGWFFDEQRILINNAIMNPSKKIFRSRVPKNNNRTRIPAGFTREAVLDLQ